MLANISIPVAELANLKPVQCTVLAGLLAFADRAGRCWPSLRKLALVTGLKLSRVHRAIAEMERGGILTRVRRGAGTLYQLAGRFVWRASRPIPPEPDCSASGTASSASETEGVAKKEIQDSNSKEGSGRLAPPTPAPTSEPAQRRDAQPASRANPFARKNWLHKLNCFVGEALSGSARMSAWSLVARAEAGEPLARDERRALDQLDAAMRSCGYRATS